MAPPRGFIEGVVIVCDTLIFFSRYCFKFFFRNARGAVGVKEFENSYIFIGYINFPFNLIAEILVIKVVRILRASSNILIIAL